MNFAPNCYAKIGVKLRRATIGPSVRFVITFDLAHPSGRLVPDRRVPRVETLG